jgi:fucose permease
MNSRRAPVALGVLSFLAFAGLGLPDGVLGVAWPSMRSELGLALDGLGALLVSTTAGYVTSSFLAGALLARMSLGVLLTLSCLFTGATLVGYALAPAWLVIVALGTVVGLGAGAIDAGINTFAATNFRPRTLHLLHASYGVGTSLGPLWMTSVLMGGASWRYGYLGIAGAQLVLAAGFAATARLWPRREGGTGATMPAGARLGETLCRPLTWLGATSFFLYLGVEAGAGAWLFSVLTEGRGMPMATAGTAVTVYWGALGVGRVAFGLAPDGLRPGRMLPPAIASAAAAAAFLALQRGPGPSVVAVALLGLSLAPVFPALIATTPERLGASHTANLVGIQVAAAALGQSTLPALLGYAAQAAGFECVPLLLLAFALGLLFVHSLVVALGTRPRVGARG